MSTRPRDKINTDHEKHCRASKPDVMKSRRVGSVIALFDVDCSNFFCIYVATCGICHEQYVVQTSNKFSERCSAHRSNWNKQDCKTDSDKDQMAL